MRQVPGTAAIRARRSHQCHRLSGHGRVDGREHVGTTTRANFVVVETDVLNQTADNVDEYTWMSFVERLLRLAVCLAHGGRTLVLVGYSTPWQWDDQPLRRFLGRVHHLALVCSDAELDRRLRGRRWMGPQERESLLGLNRRFKEMPDVHRIDTTTTAPAAVADEVTGLLAELTR